MAALFGNLEPFTSDQNFHDYQEQLDFYFEANSVEDDNKKRAILLTAVGTSVFRLIKDLCFPNSPKDKTYGELCELLKEHFDPAPAKYVQRKKFEDRARHSHESIQDYVVSLKKLAEFCKFGDNLKERLLDRFVMGVNDETIQRKLLQEEDLTLEKAVRIAQTTLESKQSVKTFENAAIHSVRNKVTRTNHTSTTGVSKCFGCGEFHKRNDCKFRNATCYNCGKVGHIKKVCRSKPTPSKSPSFKPKSTSPSNPPNTPFRKKSFRQNNIEDEASTTISNASAQYELFHYHSDKQESKKPIFIDVEINNKSIKFQLDTGASITVIDRHSFEKLGLEGTLEPSDKILKSYSGGNIQVLGETTVSVRYQNENYELPLVVVDTAGPPLLGRNWLSSIKLNWNELFSVSDTLYKILLDHEQVFSNELGHLKDFKASIKIKDSCMPKFMKARSPPFSLRERNDDELRRLEKVGVIERVTYSEWASPVVAVPKSSGEIRLCGDYKRTVNEVALTDVHPLPTKDDLLFKLRGGSSFSEIDLSNAYNQIELDDDSKNLTTINTQKGLYRYNRLVFGISAAPSIFQRTMESLLQDIDGCAVYIDNIYVTGKTDKEHLSNLKKVLSKLEASGLKLRKDKCSFMKSEISFLGYQLSSDGVRPQPDKIRAIQEAHPPENIQQLRSFLGLVNYYGNFVPNISSELAPLYQLLEEKSKWGWTSIHQQCFNKARKFLISDKLLVHYDPDRKLILSCDASPYGIGAVLAHIMDNGKEQPIAYASRTLMAAEKNYSQLDKEGLAVTFGVKKFHKYIYGRNFTIYTDHKPLLGLLGEKKPIPENASARVTRWALTLAGYNYQLCYRPGKDNANSDALSRLPLTTLKTEIPVPFEINELFSLFDGSMTTSVEIGQETQKDPLLSKVFDFVKNGWPCGLSSKEDDQMKTYFDRRLQLSIDNDCLLWGSRVVIPHKFRQNVLQMFHETHVGMNRMKSLCRSYIWWPQIDKDIECFVRQCTDCQRFQNNPPKVPLQTWTLPDGPWTRLHLDFAGPFMGHMFLVLTDPFSKWIDVKVMSNITAELTILQLRGIFANFGLPECIVSDNGPTFTSEKFQTFLKRNGVKHITSSPFHPSTNGAAEKAVQTFKNSMKRMSYKGSIQEKVLRFLTKYRVTPHTSTGETPSEILLGRRMKTHLDLLFPKFYDSVENHMTKQKHYYDSHTRDKYVDVRDKVYVKNYSAQGDPWIPGVVTSKAGSVSFKVQTDQHGLVRRHANQLQPRFVSGSDSSLDLPLPGSDVELPRNVSCSSVPVTEPSPLTSGEERETSEIVGDTPTQTSEVPTFEPRRSLRVRKAPNKLNL